MKQITILFLLLIYSTAEWLPKILWTFWDKPILPNTIQNLFLKNKIKYANGWDIRVLNKANYNHYLEQIPNFIGFPTNFKYLKQAHKADFIRFTLLSYYGGLWIDFGTFMTQNLDWISLENLIKDTNVQNRYSNQPQVLLFSLEKYEYNWFHYDINKQQTYKIAPGYQIWFIAACQKSKFLNQVLRIALLALEKDSFSFIPQLKGDEYFEHQMRRKNIRVHSFDHYLLINSIMQLVLQTKQQQLDLKQGERELAVWYYNIWHINSLQGPFGYLKFDSHEKFQRVNFLYLFSENTLAQINIKTRYFIKLNSPNRIFIQNFFMAPNTLLGAFILQLRGVYHDQIMKYFCPQDYGIKNNSIIAKYLIGDQQTQWQKLYKIQQRVHQVCKPLKRFIIVGSLFVIGFIIAVIFIMVHIWKRWKIYKGYIKDQRGQKIPQTESCAF